jgi:UDP-glucose 4-epimerase
VPKLLADADVVIQAAATTSGSKDIVGRPHIHITDNAVMNSYILRACHDLSIGRFIFFSCSVMYASSATPQREQDFDPSVEMQPNYFGIGWTKVYVEQMCEFFARAGRTRHRVAPRREHAGARKDVVERRARAMMWRVHRVVRRKYHTYQRKLVRPRLEPWNWRRCSV